MSGPEKAACPVLTDRLRQTAEWLVIRSDIVGKRGAYHLEIEYREAANDLAAAADEIDQLRGSQRRYLSAQDNTELPS